MFRTRSILLIGGVLAALPLLATAQTGRGSTTTATTSSTSSTTVPADNLVKKYSTLAGSEENARSLVKGLRNGTEVTLSSASGGETRITPPTGKMGYGNVKITLALADAQLSKISNPTNADLQKALMNSENGILTLRAQGMGWGNIAQTLGYKLGDVMRASSAKDASGAAKKEERAQSQQVARDSRANGGRPDNVRPEKVDRPEKPQRPERGGR